MSVSLPNGAVIHIASGYAASKTMSVLSNASSAVATLEASHGVGVGEYVEITSGWSRLNNKILKATAVATNDVTFGGVDTSSTTIYPAASGTGSVREISGWTQLSQILTSQSEGGQQNFENYQFLESDREVSIPTSKSAGRLTLTVADDPTLAGFILAVVANDDRLQRAVRVTLPSGAVILYNAYISVNKTPSLNVNQVMSCEVSLSFLAEPQRYA
jgi:hypothetical protein